MRISNTTTLLQQISTGASFQLKRGELHTLEGAAKRWDTLLNHFRSDNTRAAREARVLTAMTDLLRPQSSGGPEGLSATASTSTENQRSSLERFRDRLSSGFFTRQTSPTTSLWEARTTFANTLLANSLEQYATPSLTEQAKDLVAGGILKQPAPELDPSTGEPIYETMGDMDTPTGIASRYGALWEGSVHSAVSMCIEDIDNNSADAGASAQPERPASQASQTSGHFALWEGSAVQSSNMAAENQGNDPDPIYDTPRNVLAQAAEKNDPFADLYAKPDKVRTSSPTSDSAPQASGSLDSAASGNDMVDGFPRPERLYASIDDLENEPIYDTPNPVLRRSTSASAMAADDGIYNTPSQTQRASTVETPASVPDSPEGITSKERHVLQTILSTALTKHVLQEPRSLQEMRTFIDDLVKKTVEELPKGALSNLVSGFTRDTHDLVEHQTKLTSLLQGALNDTVTQPALFKNGMCNAMSESFVQERPSIDGVRIPPEISSSADVTAEYERLLDGYCVSATEKRVLTFLMGPQGRLAFDSILGDANRPEGAPLLNPNAHSEHDPLQLERTGLPGAGGYCSLFRNDSGDNILEVTIPLAPSGRVLDIALPDGSNISVQANSRHAMAEMSFTVIIPRIEDPADPRQSVPLDVDLMVIGMRLEANEEPSFRVTGN